MGEKEIREIFETYGYPNLAKRFAFKFWLGGYVENEEELEIFLQTFEFDDDHSFLFDKVLYHFLTFKQICRSREIPEDLLYFL